MQGISDIKIVGLGVDKTRHTVTRQQPHIELFFQLSHRAPAGWCEVFNSMLIKHPSTPRVEETKGMFIETWVSEPYDTINLLEKLKEAVTACSRQYIKRIELATKLAGNSKSIADRRNR